MPRKGKKRREAHRERKLERAEATPLSSEEETARLARAKAKAEHEAERIIGQLLSLEQEGRLGVELFRG